ncbi:piRNA biogenesis protein EXD1-like [Mytilus edulis]|uniref:piRNA biogenesis protein EXD1-like n=1 Tax=Mytilus edulis TaxID=6550 RepID=UPI0039EE9973
MATKRNSEQDYKDQQQQSDGPTSNKKVKQNSVNSDTSINEDKTNETNDSNAGDVIKPDNIDQQQQSDGSTINANKISDTNKDDGLFGRKSDGEQTLSGSIQVGTNETSSYKYIDTKGKFSSAINELNDKIKDGKTMIAFDCEGERLSRFGSVTMVNIGTRDMVYLIDVLKIRGNVFDDGLRSILENNTIEKLMFDCREDADALFHLHKINLNGVLDVQLLEASERMKRNRRHKFLASLQTCLKSVLSDKTLLSLKIQGQQKMHTTTDIWEKRPLEEVMLKYAACDVLALFQIYGKLKYIMPHTTWKYASSLYCDDKRFQERKSSGDGNAELPKGLRNIIL